jgi:hypothetical protein
MNLIAGSSLVLSVGLTLTLVRLFQEGHFYTACGLVCGLGFAALLFSLGIFVKNENQRP